MKLFNKDKLPSSEAIRYAEEQTKIYKQQVIKATNDYIQLQSNWNSLREWLEENYKDTQDIWYVKIINKMNELEGGDNDTTIK